jgi:Photoprotection regulator fluorescence recovery protein
MAALASSPRDAWKIDDYLSERRQKTDELFDYRYSVRPEVFGLLLRQGWLKESDLAGLRQDKLEMIMRWKII